MAISRTSATFRPKRTWKPKRRDKNMKRRRKRKQWYRKNRNRIRQKSKQRYKKLRNNPTYKRWQKKKRNERTKRKLRTAEIESPCPHEGVPEIFFLFDESEDTIDVDLGFVCDIDPDEDDLLVWSLDDKEYKVVNVEEFAEGVLFVEEEDYENFMRLLEDSYGGMEEKLASKYLAARGLRRRTPTQMQVDNLKLDISDARFDKAMGMFAKMVGGSYDRQRGVITLPWETGRNRKFPKQLQVLYRKFPCGMLQRTFGPDSGAPCVSFDVIPKIPNANSSKMYKSIQGDAVHAKKLFAQFLHHLKRVGDALMIAAQKDNMPLERRTVMMTRRVATRWVQSSEVSVDRRGYARDDEGHSWYVGKQYAGWRGTAAQAAKHLPKGPDEDRTVKFTPEAEDRLVTEAKKLYLILAGKGITKHNKFLDKVSFYRNVTPRQLGYLNSLRKQYAADLSKMDDRAAKHLLFFTYRDPVISSTTPKGALKHLSWFVNLDEKDKSGNYLMRKKR